MTDPELREVATRLAQLKLYRFWVVALQEATKRDFQADAKLSAAYEKEIEVLNREIAIVQRELALAEQERDFYLQAYETTKKKGISVGCVFKKIFTLGISNCK